MRWFITFIITFLVMVICFKLGQITGRIDYNKELETANVKLEKCQTVCVEEFEKMAC